jgi:hypothetical protein
MTSGWSPTSGWESYEPWKLWYLRESGRVDPPPQRPSVRLFVAYRVFSAPEGIRTEVEVTGWNRLRSLPRSWRFAGGRGRSWAGTRSASPNTPITTVSP